MESLAEDITFSAGILGRCQRGDRQNSEIARCSAAVSAVL
jgi:hypothetical protein